MEKNLVKGILATVQNEGADLTEFKPAVLDINDREVMAKALCCVEPNIYQFPVNRIDLLIYCDDSGVHDEEAVATMIVKIDCKIAHVIIKNLFVCKLSNGHVVSLTDDECVSILGNLKITAFGYFPTRYLLFNIDSGGKWDVGIRL